MTLGEADKMLLLLTNKTDCKGCEAIDIARKSMQAWAKITKEIESDNMIGDFEKDLVMAVINKRFKEAIK